MAYVGVDLHRKRSHVVALDPTGQVVLSRRIGNAPPSLGIIPGLTTLFGPAGRQWLAELDLPAAARGRLDAGLRLLTRMCRSTSKAQEPSMVKSSAGRPSRSGLSAAATLGTSSTAASARPITRMRRFMPCPQTTGTNDAPMISVH
jgi:hypothetical protein